MSLKGELATPGPRAVTAAAAVDKHVTGAHARKLQRSGNHRMGGRRHGAKVSASLRRVCGSRSGVARRGHGARWEAPTSARRDQ